MEGRAEVDIHLKGCDFCCAELQLLRHRSGPEEYLLTEMPGQLRRLAENLVTGSTPFISVAFGRSRHSH